MSFKKLKKPLLFTTTAFLTLYPVCLAEAATTSYASELSSQRLLQTTSQTPQYSQPRTNLNRLLLASDTPSIESLQSTLADYKAQLRTLESRVSDPAKLATLREAISDLQSQLQTAETLRDLYLQAQAQLQATLTRYEQANAERIKAQEAYQQATTYHQEISTAYQEAQTREQSAILSLNNARTTLTQATNQYNQATSNLQSATQQATDALTALENARQSALTASSNLAEARTNYNTALQTFNEATSNKTAAGQALDAARTALQSAQHAYDTNLIPDPNWTAPTQQVAHTRQVQQTRLVPQTQLVERIGYTFNESANILPPLSASTWSGAGTGFQGSQPAINEGILKFSYMNQSVTYTANANLSGTLALTVDFRNLDQNRNQQDTYEFRIRTYNAQGDVNGEAYHYVNYWHDWMTRTIEVTPNSPVTSYEVILTGFDAGYWYGTYGPEMRNPRLSGYVTTETRYFEEVTTYVEETYYTTETYYTEEPVLTQGTLNVDIREGGQATFNAPAGATFTGSNLRYEAITRPTCGVNITPTVDGLSSVTIRATNSAWGDPCGGWVKHVVGTISYLGQPTAPLIKNPALLPALEQAQATFNEASTNYAAAESVTSAAEQTFNEADTDLTNKQSQYESANDQVTAAEATYNEAVAAKQLAATEFATVEATKVEAEQVATTAETEHATATTQLAETESTFQAASVKVTEAETHLEAATSNEATLKDDAAVADTKAADSLTVLKTQLKTAETTTQKVETEIAAVPEEGSADLPAELSAENLMEVNLETVDPQELTDEQVTALQEAAYETFLTAEAGSPEYEQALDALYLAAEADDIVLPAELAAIPGLAAATELVNFLGNAGADMSPKVREESKKVVVTAVVAAGAAIQSAAAAASMSSASTRKIGK